MRTLALILLTLFVAPCTFADKPNILLITCDNLGYGDLKMYRPESSIETPRLDQLASEGARLTQFYTASPTCTVSRE
jgi:arylsulfatase A